MLQSNEWNIRIKRQVQKDFVILPSAVRQQIIALLLEIRYQGPVRGNWKNYSKLGKDKHHCHIKSGKPTYVCCWQAYPALRNVEVYYVGTHEKAPY
jgi:hypothetical protein